MFKAKKIHVVLFGPCMSGKTTLFNQLQREYKSFPVKNEDLTDNTYIPTSVCCEHAKISIPDMYMEIQCWDTSGNTDMLSVYRNFFSKSNFSSQQVDIGLVIVDSSYTDITTFEKWNQLSQMVSIQQSVIIINKIKGKCLSRSSKLFTTMEMYCIKKNLFHIQLDVSVEYNHILDIIQIYMFSNAECKYITQIQNNQMVSSRNRSVSEPLVSNLKYFPKIEDLSKHIDLYFYYQSIHSFIPWCLKNRETKNNSPLVYKRNSWPLSRIDSRNSIQDMDSPK
jgi:GTPase Era involved in 16S rRNA processing